MYQPHVKQFGFTLIEMIVALALFSVVITVSVGALLMLVGTNEQLQGEQSVMTNLSFALDSMTREIRTGTYYYCDSKNNTSGSNNIFNSSTDLDGVNVLKSVSGSVTNYYSQDCQNGNPGLALRFHGVAFVESGNSVTGATAERILYYFDKNDGKIYRRVGGGTEQSIVSDGILIKSANFFVTGSDPITTNPGSPDTAQPTMTIFIEATDPADPTGKSYYLQTTITQRILDV